eukprot:3874703-Rhodomonas_salina.2
MITVARVWRSHAAIALIALALETLASEPRPGRLATEPGRLATEGRRLAKLVAAARGVAKAVLGVRRVAGELGILEHERRGARAHLGPQHTMLGFGHRRLPPEHNATQHLAARTGIRRLLARVAPERLAPIRLRLGPIRRLGLTAAETMSASDSSRGVWRRAGGVMRIPGPELRVSGCWLLADAAAAAAAVAAGAGAPPPPGGARQTLRQHHAQHCPQAHSATTLRLAGRAGLTTHLFLLLLLLPGIGHRLATAQPSSAPGITSRSRSTLRSTLPP